MSFRNLNDEWDSTCSLSPCWHSEWKQSLCRDGTRTGRYYQAGQCLANAETCYQHVTFQDLDGRISEKSWLETAQVLFHADTRNRSTPKDGQYQLGGTDVHCSLRCWVVGQHSGPWGALIMSNHISVVFSRPGLGLKASASAWIDFGLAQDVDRNTTV